MTSVAYSPVRTRVAKPALVIAGGCMLLTARPAIVASTEHPTLALVAIFVLLAIVGSRVSIPTPGAPTVAPIAALVVGIAAFGIGRVLVGGRSVGTVTLTAVALHAGAAVAEEIWFRRLVYGWLSIGGSRLAILGSAGLFAVVHVTTYGVWVLPLDVAAGALLAWQRSVTGSWRVPALTHVVANVLALW
jgi:hypothetical protein